MAEFFTMIWKNIVMFFSTYHWLTDTLDIVLVAFFIFFIIRLVRDSRAEQLIKGILLLAVMYFAAYLLDLTTVGYLLKAFFDNGLLVLMVIFQPEIRRALEQAGHSRKGFWRIFGGLSSVDNSAQVEQWDKAIDATAKAVDILQKNKMGALIVLERTTRLGEIVHSGTIIEAEPSGELIANIFFNKAPLHDGAMIIREGKIYAAGCILPLSENHQISRELGTRHRAGVGMSENSDALVVIVSEETGIVSLADGGELMRNFTKETLSKTLADRLLWNKQQEGKISAWRRSRKGSQE